DSFCDVLFKDNNLLPRIDRIKAISNHELFEQVFPHFISKISDYVSSFVDYGCVAEQLMNKVGMSYNTARIKADDYCSGITFYFKEYK
ncbi:MAG: hypothetical protein ACRCXT_16355, partial [Paraclostridium sp.]